MKNYFDIAGKGIVITGASRGLGRSMALGLAEAGAHIVAAATNGALLAELEREIEGKGQSCGAFAADVSSEEEVEALAAFAARKLGQVDVLINCAGINRRGLLTEMSKADWDDTIGVNLTGSFLCIKHFAPLMKSRKRGKIVNIASIMSVAAAAMAGPYCASKGGVQQLTRAAALELAADNIQVNAIAPGYFATEMNDKYLNDPEKAAALLSKVPMGRWGEGDELVGAAIYLSSDASNFVTGHVLCVDGGYLCL
ncbi:SDR family NAD(P)-dependent oxidoreductase [Bacilliculturomica massiliensis]|uniref:SDR family NAD(P)-dependent oxidoreductase n=1 Tax=Bacilliculturomica massiliensis TaxID=1917867 RepID=UPI00103186B9|nr:glucose 1-dehydrogenase [Bacilliculturomica massiliensis]